MCYTLNLYDNHDDDDEDKMKINKVKTKQKNNNAIVVGHALEIYGGGSNILFWYKYSRN